MLGGLSERVSSVAWSPDGKTLASGSYDTIVRLWDVNSGKTIQVLQGHSGEVCSVAFSPDGKMLASGGADKSARLWDVRSGNVIHVLQGHSGEIYSVAWSPDGRTLASGSRDNRVRFWGVKSGNTTQVLQGHSHWVIDIAWSPDGKTLASGSSDGSVRLWDVKSGNAMQLSQVHSGWVNSVASGQDGKRLASGSSDGSVRLWDVDTGEAIHVLQRYRSEIRSVTFSPDGKTLASGSEDSSVWLWDVKCGKAIQVLQGHSGGVRSVSWSLNGVTLASGSFDKSVRLWDVNSGKALQVLQWHDERVSSIVFSPDGKMLASGSNNNSVRLWEANSGKTMRVLEGHSAEVDNLAFSPDGKALASGSRDKSVRLWDVNSGNAMQVLDGHSDSVNTVFWSMDSKLLVSGSDDITIRIWDAVSYKCLTVIANGAPVLSISFNKQGQLISGDGAPNNAVRLWECRNNQWYLKWSSPQQSLCMAGCIIKGVKDLSLNNRRLIEQRAAEIKFINAQNTNSKMIVDNNSQDEKKQKNEIETVASHDAPTDTKQNQTSFSSLNTVKADNEKQTLADNKMSVQNITYNFNIGSINYSASIPGQPLINTLNASISIDTVNQTHAINLPAQSPPHIDKEFGQEKAKIKRAKLVSISDYLLLNIQELNYKLETDANYLQVHKLKELVDAGKNIITAVNEKVIEEEYLLHGILCLATAHELLSVKKQEQQQEKVQLAILLEINCANISSSPARHRLHWYAEIGNRSLFNFWLNYQDTRNNLAANSDYPHSMLYVANEKGDTPLHIASRYGHVRIIKIILDSMEKMVKLSEWINKQNKQGQSALHLAVAQEQVRYYQSKQDYLDTIKLLLKAGSDQNLTDNQQKTPQDIASKNNERDVINLFLSPQTNVFTQEVTKNRQVSIPHLATRENLIMQHPQSVPPKNFALPVNPVMPASRSRLFVSDQRPSDYDYAQLSSAVYHDNGGVLPAGWEVYPNGLRNDTKSWLGYFNAKSGYFGALYINRLTKQLVLAHRGTLVSNPASLSIDLQAIAKNQIHSQQWVMCKFIQEAVEIAKKEGYHLSSTGHSLGAWLAELTVFLCHHRYNYRAINAVTFESPGVVSAVELLRSDNQTGILMSYNNLDIVTYFSYPNRINTCNPHVGTLFYMQPATYHDYKWENHDLAAHHMDGLVALFAGAPNHLPKCTPMKDWPTGSELKQFFKEGKIENGYLPDIAKLNDEKQFRLIFQAHFFPDNDWVLNKKLYLKHFSVEGQDFLRAFWKKYQQLLQSTEKEHVAPYLLDSLGCSPKLVGLLMSFELDNPMNLLSLTADCTCLSVEIFRRELGIEWQNMQPTLQHRIVDDSINANKEIAKMKEELQKIKQDQLESQETSASLVAADELALHVEEYNLSQMHLPQGAEVPKGLTDLPPGFFANAPKQPLFAAKGKAVVKMGTIIQTALYVQAPKQAAKEEDKDQDKKTLEQTQTMSLT